MPWIPLKRGLISFTAKASNPPPFIKRSLLQISVLTIPMQRHIMTKNHQKPDDFKPILGIA